MFVQRHASTLPIMDLLRCVSKKAEQKVCPIVCFLVALFDTNKGRPKEA